MGRMTGAPWAREREKGMTGEGEKESKTEGKKVEERPKEA